MSDVNSRKIKKEEDLYIPDRKRRQLVGESASGRRISRSSRGNSRDDTVVEEANFILLVKSLPKDRICPRNCKDHHIIVQGRQLELHCSTLLDGDRFWLFPLEEAFKEGVLKIWLREKHFNNVMLQLKPGLFSVRNQKSLLINQKHAIPIIKWELDRGY